MANQYNQWAPTAPVQLPIDTYMKAGIYSEQRAQQYQKNLSDVFNAYNSVEAVSPNAQAYYDEAISGLEKSISDVSKMNLKTPEAYRKFMQAVSDPVNSKKIMNVYKDWANYAKRQAELQEYQKKNPDVNASRYLEAFNRVALEEGKSSEFNPDRFSNLGNLAEYVDIDKEIEDRVQKIHPDSDEATKILGNIDVTERRSGVSQSKIRKYVVSKLASDPRYAGQIKRNIEYKGYLLNPTNINEGLKTLGSQYSNILQETGDDLNKQLSALRGDLSDDKLTEKRLKDKDFAGKELTILNALSELNTYKDTEGKPLTGQELILRMEKEQIVNTASQLAWHDNKYAEQWDPLYLLKVKSNLAFSNAVRLRQMAQADLLRQQGAYTAIPGSRTQSVTSSPSEWNRYGKENMGFKHITLNEAGRLTEDNYKSEFLFTGTSSVGPAAKVGSMGVSMNKQISIDPKYRGKFIPLDAIEYVDVSTPSQIADAKRRGLVRIGGEGNVAKTARGITTAVFGSSAAPEKEMYVDPKSIYNSKEAATTGRFKLAKQEVKDMVTTGLLPGAERDALLANMDSKDPNVSSEAYQKAISAFINAHSSTESIYSQGYADMRSGTPETMVLISNTLDGLEIRKNGTAASNITNSKADKEAIRRVLLTAPNKEDPNSRLVQFVPVGFSGKATYKVQDGNNVYYIEALPEDQAATLNANWHLKKALSSEVGGVTRANPNDPNNTDMFIKQVDLNGNIYSGYVPGGLSKDAQDRYRNLYESQISTIMKEAGVDRVRAEALLMNADKRASKPFVTVGSTVLGTEKTISLPGVLINKVNDVYQPWGRVGPYEYRTLDDQINLGYLMTTQTPLFNYQTQSIMSQKMQDANLSADLISQYMSNQ